MKKLYLLVIIIAFVSCKNEKKANNIEKKANEVENKIKEEPKEKGLQVTFNTVITSDMDLLLRYTEKETLRFNPKDFIKVNVKGSNVPQNIEFILPENILPTNMRLNFEGSIQDSILVNQANFKMRERSFEISKDKIWNFLNPNKLTNFNKEENTFIIEKSKKNNLPGFNFRPILIQRLEERVY